MKKLSLVKFMLVVAIIGVAARSMAGEGGQSAYTPQIRDVEGRVVTGSVASLERVMLGGIEQTILIRGKDSNKPVLLFLHGGPGSAHIGFYQGFQTPELEDNFVVVQWDQRGAGKSYSDDLTEDDMHIENFLGDIKELTNYLRDRFKQDKIFMLGHSWGSAMGFLTIAQYPELYHAYIGAGEAADWNRRQIASFNWGLHQARQNDDQQAVTELEAIMPFDYADIEDVNVKDKWVSALGGHHHKKEAYQKVKSQLGNGPEYTEADVKSFMKGLSWSSRTADAEAAVYNYSLFKMLPEVTIPIYFFSGRYDYITPTALAVEYFEAVKAPKKEFIWFEESGHTMIFEEPEKMTRELIKIAKETLQ